jgi:hypothetical protein
MYVSQGQGRSQIGSIPYSYRFQLLLGPTDLKTLRLVCSQFNRAFEAQVLSTLVISVTISTLVQSLDMLQMFALRDGETRRAAHHARTLKIEFLSPTMSLTPEPSITPVPETQVSPSPPSPPSPPSIKRRFASAISSLSRLFK